MQLTAAAVTPPAKHAARRPAEAADATAADAGVSQTGILMVTLRPTRKLKTLLPSRGAERTDSDTALGDWYVNRIVVDRRPLLILVSSTSLLPMLLPARDVRDLPFRIAELVGARLRRQGVSSAIIDAEKRAMTPVAVGPTVDRSILGVMVDFAKSVPCHLESNEWDDTTLWLVEARLAQTPCYAGRRMESVVFPENKAPELLSAKWGAG